MKMEILKLCSMVYLVYLHSTAEGATFNVGQNGAKADGKTDDAKAFEMTWTQACESSGPATILVPKGTYSVGPVKLTGPCKNVPSITIQMDGVLKALTDLSNSKTGDWFYFGNVEGLTITGGGTFDGQGEAVWHTNDCVHNPKCSVLPNNLKFIAANNLVLNGFTSLNSKYFHIGVVECSKVKINNLKVIAPDESPNTDGMHIERSSDVSIHDTKITTGDDCISLGQGLTNVEIAGITCGPGHGISIGSLGKYPNEKDVTGIIIRDSTMSGTMNGIRIKSWANSPSPSKVSNVTFENVQMNNVGNPIIIDQLYCPSGKCSLQTPSSVAISDVTIRNIRGTYTSNVGVTLHCSSGLPCKNVKLEEINLEWKGQGAAAAAVAKASCMNVKAAYSGKQIPSPC